MRINKYIAAATGLGRRAADEAILQNRVTVNGHAPDAGQQIATGDIVVLDDKTLSLRATQVTVMLNKPVGYVVSRDGQGSHTIYELLPPELQALKPIGRLDKDSSGLLLLTTDGQLAQELTHPSYKKVKSYEIGLDKPLSPLHRQMISDHGLQLDDGPSRLQLSRIDGRLDDKAWAVTMHEGRNRQIRRTFEAVGYRVKRLHRVGFGPYQLDGLSAGLYTKL